jgi:signal peptidase II
MTLLAAIGRRRGYFGLAAAVFVLDQASKIAADQLLRGLGPVTVIPGFFNLWYSRNRGGLFGYFAGWPDPWRTVLLTVFPLLAVGAIVVFLAKTEEPDRRTMAGLAAILGGATGNLIDRALRGEVVDFLDAYVSHRGTAQWLVDRFGTAHWPTFNLADSAIVVGAGLLLLDLVLPDPSTGPVPELPAGGPAGDSRGGE